MLHLYWNFYPSKTQSTYTMFSKRDISFWYLNIQHPPIEWTTNTEFKSIQDPSTVHACTPLLKFPPIKNRIRMHHVSQIKRPILIFIFNISINRTYYLHRNKKQATPYIYSNAECPVSTAFNNCWPFFMFLLVLNSRPLPRFSEWLDHVCHPIYCVPS